jgi:hypothetical protein
MQGTRFRASLAAAAVCVGAALLLAPAGLGASGRAADDICHLQSNSSWRSLDSGVNTLSNKISAAFAGGSASDGVAAAKSIAVKIRAERDMIKRASGSKKLKDTLVTLYDRAAVMYDRLAQKLPTIAPLMAEVKKNPGDVQS